MTVVIFGSTGMTGLCALEAAISKGLKVRAFVRDPSKLPEEFRSAVDIKQGDCLNYADVLDAVKGVQSVCVVLGTRNDLRPTTDMSTGTKNILRAMHEEGVQIISICLSAFLFYEPQNVPAPFVHLNGEHQIMFDLVKSSGLNYIAILPPHIADQKKTGYLTFHDKAAERRVVSKYDLGQFLIDSLSMPEHYKQVCGICSK